MAMGKSWTFNWCPSQTVTIQQRDATTKMGFTPAKVKMFAPSMGQGNGCASGAECTSPIISIDNTAMANQNNLPLGGGDEANAPKVSNSQDKASPPAQKRFKPDENTRNQNNDDNDETNQPEGSNNARHLGGRPPVQCFMKSATRNKNPTPCGTSDIEGSVVPLSTYENIIPQSKHGSGCRNNADLIASRGDGKFFL